MIFQLAEWDEPTYNNIKHTIFFVASKSNSESQHLHQKMSPQCILPLWRQPLHLPSLARHLPIVAESYAKYAWTSPLPLLVYRGLWLLPSLGPAATMETWWKHERSAKCQAFSCKIITCWRHGINDVSGTFREPLADDPHLHICAAMSILKM